MFKTGSSDIVSQCQEFFNFSDVSELIFRRKRKFNKRFTASDKLLCYTVKSAGRIEAQVAWRDHWFQPAVRLSLEKRCKGMQLPHSRSAPRAQSTDWRRRPDSRVQHRRFQAGLLQCTVEWRTGGDFDKLQRAQNNLARVVCQRRARTDARPLLHSLHWLPVKQRVLRARVRRPSPANNKRRRATRQWILFMTDHAEKHAKMQQIFLIWTLLGAIVSRYTF